MHTPIEGKPELVEHYRQKITKDSIRKNPHYAAMVHSLDENVGRVLAKLDQLGIAEKTLVIFTSDNGGFVNASKLHKDLPVANNTPLRSGKGSCYEGGIRVPLIMRGPGVVQGGECREPVFSCDLLPTVLRAVGLSEDVPSPGDGLDITPVLKNPKATLPREALFFHYPHYYATTSPVSAMRKGRWKLLEYFEDGRTELYDLSQDLGEENDLALAEPELAKALVEQLHAWRKDVKAQEPERNPAHRRAEPE